MKVSVSLGVFILAYSYSVRWGSILKIIKLPGESYLSGSSPPKNSLMSAIRAGPSASKVGKAFTSRAWAASLSCADDTAHKENSRNLRLKSWRLPLQVLFIRARTFRLASLATRSVHYSSGRSLCWHIRAYSPFCCRLLSLTPVQGYSIHLC